MSPSTDKTLTVSLTGNPTKGRVLITLTPPEGTDANDAGKRTPLDICCVLDVSGSMATGADLKGKQLPLGMTFNVLDIVKHSVKTIVTTMQDDDRIAIVTFTDYAEIIADFTPMNATNKLRLLRRIDELTPLSSTNLWDGLETGMELIIGAHSAQSRPTSLFLLTDGMPNVEPPAGHIPALKMFLDTRITSSAPPFTIHTFGFGYSIDTPLLLEIAKIGGGGYNFIPDVGMVGTVFVNAVASAYAVYAQHVKVDVQEIANGRTGRRGNFKIEVKGKIESTQTNRGIRFDSADIQYGQPKYYVLDITPSLPPSLYVSATYRSVTSNSTIQTNTAILSSAQKPTKEELADIEYHAAAFAVASILLDATPENRNDSAKALKDMETRLTSEPVLSWHPNAAALARDVGGQALASVDDQESYDLWGRHYAPCYARAHQQQHCLNYKDSGLQAYGISPAIQRERVTLEHAFHTTPIVTPTVDPEPQTTSSFPPPPAGGPMGPSVFLQSRSPPSPVSSSTLSLQSTSGVSTPNSLGASQLGRTPSPRYREMYNQFSQYAPELSTSGNSSRMVTLSRLKNFINQRRQQQQQSPITNQGMNGPSSLPGQQGPLKVMPGLPGMYDPSLLTAVPGAPTISPSPMSMYYDSEAPCFTGRCLVDLSGGMGPIRVDELRRGVSVQTLKGPREVVAVVRTCVRSGQTPLCYRGGLEITPWHPVMFLGEGEVGMERWVFPAHVMKPGMVCCDAVYSVLLERGASENSESCADAHSISISGVWCVTLGHGIVQRCRKIRSEDGVDVRTHAFLGSYNEVVKDLSRLNGFFEDGVVKCKGVRRGADGMVCGFVGEGV